MAGIWTLEEREAIRDVVLEHGPVREALIKFMEAKVAEMNGNCADAMRSVPRRFEHGSDYAAQAGVYARLLGELKAEASRKV